MYKRICRIKYNLKKKVKMCIAITKKKKGKKYQNINLNRSVHRTCNTIVSRTYMLICEKYRFAIVIKLVVFLNFDLTRI